MAKATLIVRERRIDGSGGIMEIKVWRDNELGKGDHLHIAGTEKPYSFTSLDQLLADFFAEVRKAGG